jgi:hypothetical protein
MFESLYYIKLIEGADQTSIYPYVTQVVQEYPSLDGYFQAECTENQVYVLKSLASVISVTSVGGLCSSGTEDSTTTRSISTGRTSKPWDNTSVPGSHANPGLIRHTSNENPFEFEDDTVSYTFTQPAYTNSSGENILLDGTGVDLVILSGGMVDVTDTEYHTAGVSRIQQFNWNTLNNVSGVNINYTTAVQSDHPKAVLAIACSNTYGWATGANIYILDRAQVDDVTCLTTVKEFHTQKANSRPTVVIGSFSYKRSTNVENKTEVNFRGTSHYQYSGIDLRKQMRPNGELTAFGLKNQILTGQGGANSNAIDKDYDAVYAAAQELNNAGVITVYSAGNLANKLEIEGGVDWNNHYKEQQPDLTLETVYYNRGSAQWTDGSIVVGNMSTEFDTYSPGEELISTTSGRGPRVDTFAIGGTFKILLGSSTYHCSGTSFAAPQVAGMACLAAQKYPTVTPYQMRRYFRDVAVSDQRLYSGKKAVTVDLGDNGDPQYFEDGKSSQGARGNIAYLNPTLYGNPTELFSSTDNDTYSHKSNLIWMKTKPWETGPNGDINGFVMNGDQNSRTIDQSPKGESVVWNAFGDTSVDPDGGWNHDADGAGQGLLLTSGVKDARLSVYSKKKYRFSVWARRKVAGYGRFYFGLYGWPTQYTTTAGQSSVSHRNVGITENANNDTEIYGVPPRPYSITSNPYFYQGQWFNDVSREDEWFLFVGHVHPYGSATDSSGTPGTIDSDSGIYNTSGTKVADINYDFVWKSNTTQTTHRCLLYYSTDENTHQQMWEPRIDDLSLPDCPSVSDLIQKKSPSYKVGDKTTNSLTTYTKPSQASNLLWQNFPDMVEGQGSQNTGGWNIGSGPASVNSRIIDDTPHGKGIVWDISTGLGHDDVAVPGVHEGYYNGGISTDWFPIDRTKKYRASIWVRRQNFGIGNWDVSGDGQSGHFYFGPNRAVYPGPEKSWFNGTEDPPYPQLLTSRYHGVVNGNPYPEVNINWKRWGNPGTNEIASGEGVKGAAGDWWLVVFHMWPAGSSTGDNDPASGIYNRLGQRVTGLYGDEFMFNSLQTQTYLRSYLVYGRNADTTQQTYDMRFDDLSHPDCPTISEICSYNPSDYAYESESPLRQSLNYTISQFNEKLTGSSS